MRAARVRTLQAGKSNTNGIVVTIAGVEVQFGGAQGTSQFASKVPLKSQKPVHEWERTPGPGAYNLAKPVGAAPLPPQLQFFGSSARRGSDIDPLRSLSAPTYYQSPGCATAIARVVVVHCAASRCRGEKEAAGTGFTHCTTRVCAGPPRTRCRRTAWAPSSSACRTRAPSTAPPTALARTTTGGPGQVCGAAGPVLVHAPHAHAHAPAPSRPKAHAASASVAPWTHACLACRRVPPGLAGQPGQAGAGQGGDQQGRRVWHHGGQVGRLGARADPGRAAAGARQLQRGRRLAQARAQGQQLGEPTPSLGCFLAADAGVCSSDEPRARQ